MKPLFITLFLLAFLAIPLKNPEARPVSYPDGWTAMTKHNGDIHSFHLHYSPTAKYSIGPRVEYRRGPEYTMTTMQLNNLLKRWNNPGSQANLYLKSGLGWADSNAGANKGKSSPAGFTGLAADWENRRYFVSYENRVIEAGDVDDRFSQKVMVGIAPYIGDYGDLHTWLMLELEHEPEDADKYTLRPHVRFFKGVHLLEAGISDQNNVIFNYILRF